MEQIDFKSDLISQIDNASATKNHDLIHKYLEYADDKSCPVEDRRKLVYKVVEYLLHLGEYDEAEKTLSRYQELSDWSGFRLLRVRKELRTKYLDLDKIYEKYESIKDMKDVPQKKDLLLAEVSYRLGRTSKNMEPSLRTCQRHINKYSPRTSTEQIESIMLDAIVSLHLNTELPKEVLPENPEVEHIINVLGKIDQYLKTSREDWENDITWNPESYLVKIWHPDDLKYVSLCVAQANGEVETARGLLDSLIKSGLEFRELDLLKERQNYLEDNKEKDMPEEISEIVLSSGWYLASLEDCDQQYRLTLLDADGNIRRYDDNTPVDNLYVPAPKELTSKICLVKLPEISHEDTQKRTVKLDSEIIYQVSALVYTVGNNAFRSSRFEWKIDIPDFVDELDWNIPMYLQATELLIGPLQLSEQDENKGICILRANSCVSSTACF